MALWALFLHIPLQKKHLLTNYGKIKMLQTLAEQWVVMGLWWGFDGIDIENIFIRFVLKFLLKFYLKFPD